MRTALGASPRSLCARVLTHAALVRLIGVSIGLAGGMFLISYLAFATGEVVLPPPAPLLAVAVGAVMVAVGTLLIVQLRALERREGSELATAHDSK